MAREAIKDFYGKMLGFIETKPNGDQVITDFNGRMLGFYRAGPDHITDFNGRILGRGNLLMTLLPRD